MTANSNVTAADELREWLIERFAFYLDQPAEAIDPDVEFAEYGMDSVYAISVISDIEDRLDREIDPTQFRERPTVSALVGYLMELTGGQLRPDGAPAR